MDTQNIHDVIHFPEGMDHDLVEGWHKLTSRQQGGRAAKAIKEPIQNALDSYPPDVPIQDRTGEILTGNRFIAVKDFGAGMTRQQIQMLYTVGGTTKFGINSLIGNFGIGFKQLFSSRLGTKKVIVTTVCEGFPVEVIFTVNNPKHVPDVSISVLHEPIDYGTMVAVYFDNDISADQCLDEAVHSLTYYPCSFKINGSKSISVWDQARTSDAYFFEDQDIDGYIEPCLPGREIKVSVLCKYEFISSEDISVLMSTKTRLYNDIRDFAYKGTPFFAGAKMLVNSNDLNVVISRDDYYCDDAFLRMMRAINKRLFAYMLHEDLVLQNNQHILANIYILKNKIGKYLDGTSDLEKSDAEYQAIKMLTEVKIFKIAEQRELYSLKDIYSHRSPDLPVYYAPQQTNLRWLGGAFKRDFIVLPPEFTLFGGLPGFYFGIFNTIFKDIVNLDKIHLDIYKIRDLVKRGIVSPESLSPEISFIRHKNLNRRQKNLKDEIDALLQLEGIKQVVSNHFSTNIREIETVFFDVGKSGMYLSTGLFDDKGQPVAGDYITNIKGLEDKQSGRSKKRGKHKILLGLNARHPLIDYLSTCLDQDRAIYSMTYLVNQLYMCQKNLIPFISLDNINKASLAKDIRTELLEYLITDP